MARRHDERPPRTPRLRGLHRARRIHIRRTLTTIQTAGKGTRAPQNSASISRRNVAMRSRPRRRASYIGAVDEGFGRAAYLVVALLGEQVDRALAVEDAILGVQPLADASGGQRV